MKAFCYEIKDEIGIHARPAGLLVKKAKEFSSRISVSINGKSAEATKLMAIMSLGVKNGQTVEITIEGMDEDAAYEGMKVFFKENL